nr:hypothetical protein [Tanacetum cinerariifolium]
MKEVFTKYGRLEDVFIARKHNKHGKRFGFSRFKDVTNPSILERLLNTIFIGTQQLRCNIARFQRRSDSLRINHRHQRTTHLLRTATNLVGSKNKSYVNILKGTHNPTPTTSNQTLNTHFTIPDPPKENTFTSIIAELESVTGVTNTHNHIIDEGFEDFFIKYLGGLYLLIQLPSHDLAFKALLNLALNSHFMSLIPWTTNFRISKLLTEIAISGLPPQLWLSNTFLSIVKHWGTVMIMDDCNKRQFNRTTERVYFIREMVPVPVNKEIIHVRVFETDEDVNSLLNDYYLDSFFDEEDYSNNSDNEHGDDNYFKHGDKSEGNDDVHGDDGKGDYSGEESHVAINSNVAFEITLIWKRKMGEGFLALFSSWRNINASCLMVIVYAPQDHREKQLLWKNLTMLIDKHNDFSIIFGDFNEVRSETKRLGTLFDRRSAAKFIEFIYTSGLCDLQMGEFEVSTLIPRGCNSSFIALVPKVDNPLVVGDFRPISLIGSQYKIIAKILANRLSRVVSLVVGDVQMAYIKGHQIIDGPLMVDEIIAWAKKYKKRVMFLKLDFEKAFDSLSWSFLFSVLVQMGFGSKWRTWIHSFLDLAFALVLVNGSLTKEFKIQRDDALIIGEWSHDNAKNLSRILTFFYLTSGLKVNFNKSKLFGIGISSVDSHSLASFIGCLASQFPSTYLGLPIGANMSRCFNWNPLVERFHKRLSKWKSKALFIGGRLTLIKSILGSLGVYYFSTFMAPKKVINQLEGIRRIFFWGGSLDDNKIPWIAWKKVISPRDQGAGSESRPPMLNKENYVQWLSRLLRYAKSRPNGKLIYNSILNGPYVRKMIPEPCDAKREITVTETFHLQTDDELSDKKLKQIEADDQAIQTILLGLPEDIYAVVDSCETAQEIWFTSNEGESIESYYHRFLKLINDLKRNKHFPEKIATPHQDQSSFNQNYLQQPMPNPEDITDPTTAMNMALALMAKAFKLNYSTPTNNSIGFHQTQGTGRLLNRVIQNAVQNPRVHNVRNPNGLIGIQGNGNQNQIGNSNLVAACAKGNVAGNPNGLIGIQGNGNQNQIGNKEYDLMAAAVDLDEIEEVNANCILMANLQQASTSGTQTDSASVYDTDGSAEVHENCDDNEIFNMFTQEEQYTELLEPIPESHQVPQNDNDVISEDTSMEQAIFEWSGGPIAPIAIQATNFGLKNDMIQQVQNSCQLHGLSGDDANKHLDKFFHVTQSTKVNGVTNDALRETFMKRRPEECYDLIENMTAHHNDWTLQPNGVNQQIKAVTPNYKTCGGPHSFNDCPATIGNTQNVYVAGAYQGNAITNPKGDLKGITTRSGTAYPGPTIPTTSSSLPSVVERETEVTKDTIHPTNNESTKDVQPSVVSTESPILTSEPVISPIIELVASPDLNFNISFADALILMPKFGTSIKSLLTNKDKLSLADLGASINLMPLSVWNNLYLLDFSPTCELTLRVGKEAITFNLDQTSRYSANYNDMTANRIDVIDMDCEEYSQEVLGFSDVIASGNPTPYHDLIVSTTSLTLTPFGNSDFLFEEVEAFLALEDDHTSSKVDQSYELKIREAKTNKSSIDESPKVKLKDLPPHLEYAFLEGDDKLPVIIVKDLSVEEKTALITLEKMLKRCEDTNLCLNWEKSHFMVKEGIVLGHKISKEGIEIDKAKVDVITKLPHPTTIKAPILIVPDWDMPFELMCDASDFAISAVLGKCQEKHFRPIHYASKTMTEAESNYTTTKKKMLAVVYAFEKFRSYFIMNKSIVYTDHSALKYLFAKKNSKARLLRLVLLLQEFTFKVIDTKGAENMAADHLS